MATLATSNDPLLPATGVPVTNPFLLTVTGINGSAVPRTVTGPDVTIRPLAGAVITGAGGGTSTMVTFLSMVVT